MKVHTVSQVFYHLYQKYSDLENYEFVRFTEARRIIDDVVYGPTLTSYPLGKYLRVPSGEKFEIIIDEERKRIFIAPWPTPEIKGLDFRWVSFLAFLNRGYYVDYPGGYRDDYRPLYEHWCNNICM